jgi:hypothetical protein
MGMYGIKQFEAVINPPQGMIMAIGAGEKRPYVVSDSLQIATVMSATGSFDHRAIDGADGAALMKRFKELVESPAGDDCVTFPSRWEGAPLPLREREGPARRQPSGRVRGPSRRAKSFSHAQSGCVLTRLRLKSVSGRSCVIAGSLGTSSVASRSSSLHRGLRLLRTPLDHRGGRISARRQQR